MVKPEKIDYIKNSYMVIDEWPTLLYLLYINHHTLQCQYFTETALLKVYNDLLMAPNVGNCSVLIPLEFSAVFDAIDYYSRFWLLSLNNQ